MRSLREDTLIIVGNFNATEAPLLDVVMKYRCRILFTTRSRYDNRTAMEIVELNPDILCELMMKFFPKGEKRIALQEYKAFKAQSADMNTVETMQERLSIRPTYRQDMIKYAKTAFYGDYDFLLLCVSESDINGLLDEYAEEQTAQRAKLQRQPKSIHRNTQNQAR